MAIDNKTRCTTLIELDSIKTKYYKIRDFIQYNDERHFIILRSEFKGGPKGEDYFNLNLYHTINKDNDNVGLSKLK
jgi:hypothetical protein